MTCLKSSLRVTDHRRVMPIPFRAYTSITSKRSAATRVGEKAIPSKSAVITIDDEWNSQYYVAWPILKESGYPFTLFIYTQWVATGGKAMTWAQLGKMRDAAVDI